MFFSLAGIPLTAGFVGKFYVVLAGIGSSLWLPVVVLVIGSAIGLFYYLRVIVIMYSPLSGRPQQVSHVARISAAGAVVLVVLTVFIIWIGVYPTQIISLLTATVGKLSIR